MFSLHKNSFRKNSIIIGLLSGLLFGIATPISKILISKTNSFTLAGLLYLGAALFFLPYFIKNKEELSYITTKKSKFTILGIILFGGFLGPVFLLFGLKLSYSSSVSIWLNMELVATAILGVLIFKDHLDLFAVIGVLFTLASGIIVSFQESQSALIPGIFISIACICWGIDNHLTAIVDQVSPKTITFIKGIFAGTTNLIIGIVLDSTMPGSFTLLLALMVGMVSYGLSISLYVSSAQQLGATRSQVLFSTGPFWGIIIAFIFLAEPINLYIIISMILLVIGILFTNVLFHNHTHKHYTVEHNHLHEHNDGHHNHEGENPNIFHTHSHKHEYLEHSHDHYPDLHHRHDHK